MVVRVEMIVVTHLLRVQTCANAGATRMKRLISVVSFYVSYGHVRNMDEQKRSGLFCTNWEVSVDLATAMRTLSKHKRGVQQKCYRS